jgi:hypothetical protein
MDGYSIAHKNYDSNPKWFHLPSAGETIYQKQLDFVSG